MDERKRSAAALRYDPDQPGAPEVVAAGHGAVADRILAAAAEHGVPVREDPLLAAALAAVSAGDQVPEDLYLAVAEVLVWAWEADRDAEARRKVAAARRTP